MAKKSGFYLSPGLDFRKSGPNIQSTPDNSNLQEKSKKVRVGGCSSYRECEAINRK